MYAVIFKAKIAKQDEEYSKAVTQMRELAFKEYACIDFVALTEGDNEIAISYWHNEQDIVKWKQNTQHLLAQQKGKQSWYQSYSVEIAEIKRSYQSS